RVDNGGWHQHVGFIAGITKHQALVACALVFRLGAVYALGDVDRLLTDDVHHATGGAVKADGGGGVANVVDHATDQIFQVNPGSGGDFAGKDGNACFDHGLTGNTGVFVLGDDGVEHGVGNLVGNFARMAFRDRLGSENRIFAHEFMSLFNSQRFNIIRRPLQSSLRSQGAELSGAVATANGALQKSLQLSPALYQAGRFFPGLAPAPDGVWSRT